MDVTGSMKAKERPDRVLVHFMRFKPSTDLPQRPRSGQENRLLVDRPVDR